MLIADISSLLSTEHRAPSATPPASACAAESRSIERRCCQRPAADPMAHTKIPPTIPDPLIAEGLVAGIRRRSARNRRLRGAAEHFNTCRQPRVPGFECPTFFLCAAAERRGLSIFTTDADFTRFAKILPIELHGRTYGEPFFKSIPGWDRPLAYRSFPHIIQPLGPHTWYTPFGVYGVPQQIGEGGMGRCLSRDRHQAETSGQAIRDPAALPSLLTTIGSRGGGEIRDIVVADRSQVVDSKDGEMSEWLKEHAWK